MRELPEHEARYIRDYVNIQSPDVDPAGLVQRVGSRRIVGRVHEMYDVRASSPAGGSSPIPQTSTPRTTSRRSSRRASSILVWASSWLSGVERSCPRQTRSGCPGSWRRFKQALAGMDDAGGAEDFQAIGIKCRDSLLAAVRDHICGLGRQRRGPAEGQRTRLAGPGGGQAPARRQGS